MRLLQYWPAPVQHLASKLPGIMMWSKRVGLHWNWDGLNKGLMMPCKAYSIGKARQLAVNKHVDGSKKAKSAGERIFLDLMTIKAQQESGITITNRNWHIVVDQYMRYKELEFYNTKSDFVEPTCKKFNEWKK